MELAKLHPQQHRHGPCHARRDLVDGDAGRYLGHGVDLHRPDAVQLGHLHVPHVPGPGALQEPLVLLHVLEGDGYLLGEGAKGQQVAPGESHPLALVSDGKDGHGHSELLVVYGEVGGVDQVVVVLVLLPVFEYRELDPVKTRVEPRMLPGVGEEEGLLVGDAGGCYPHRRKVVLHLDLPPFHVVLTHGSLRRGPVDESIVAPA
mmetsp:Transcript_30843/g.72061  ORF Transcript_30843/g.72061 Transcript_30843/m.72061 type:complete len:204 (+) Transcript_30843:338-949(+)